MGLGEGFNVAWRHGAAQLDATTYKKNATKNATKECLMIVGILVLSFRFSFYWGGHYKTIFSYIAPPVQPPSRHPIISISCCLFKAF